MEKQVIIAERLVKRYGHFAAVNDISFRVKQGGFYGLLGPNGAGKTTTMRMIYQVTPITSGKLTVLGLKSGMESRAIRARLGVIPQIDNLDEELSVRENLVVYARFNDIDIHTANRRADELLDFMELSLRANSDIRSLSGGMKRRLTLARGLMNNPELLILDEPTTGLDPQVRITLWNKLEDLRRQGVTILLSTHYMDEAERLTDYLYIMDNGQIQAEGNPRNLVDEQASREVVEVRLYTVTAEQVETWARSRQLTPHRLSADRITFYTDNGYDLGQSLAAFGIDRRYIYQRPGNLEDVFLNLTGRALRE